MIKVIITAPKGAMDSMIVEEAWKNPKLEIIGCIGNPKKDYIGKDIGDVVPGIGQKTGVFVYGSIDEIIDSCDVVLSGECRRFGIGQATLRANTRFTPHHRRV